MTMNAMNMQMLKMKMMPQTSSSGHVVSTESTSDYVKDMLVKPLTVGATTAVAASMLWNIPTKNIAVFGKDLPWWLVVAGAAAVSSVGAESLTRWVFPHIGEKFSEPTSMAVSAGMNGAALAGVLHLANQAAIPELGLWTILGTGAVAEIVGGTIYEKVVNPMILS